MKLKKTGFILLSLILLLAALPAVSSAAKLSLRVELNGEKMSFPDAQPLVDKSNRVQVPVRFVSEALGAKVDWNSKTKKVTVNLNSNQIVLTLGKKAYTVNGKTKQMDTVALRKSDRTYVPLRFVSEALGAQVNWDSLNYMVSIHTGAGASGAKGNDANTEKPFDWEAWEASRNVEGKSEKIKLEGFSFNGFYNSGLSVLDSGYDPKTKKGPILQLLVSFGHVGDDLSQQQKDAEEILSQRIDKKTVDSVMNYVKQKKLEEDELAKKTFTDETFKVIVQSQTYGDININVWYK
ncbi:copper amine oxidase N-terminal domain-containing protein [Paenibacillus sp. alder61]|uniref:Copper amine oxidase N-terminal domain-containing protein n=1 Tax=Paenibacillus faecis TaxID=862114 RepID=A0A5D0D078_9BACL|nr:MULTISPECIES: copper amine oxidase N-terminal domain-containing protein [Paenibacillus]MCA1293766.1 copper amine oxidase N-terminal domain-containing protein [Paenibacillus sp. alder61]TYA15353.1 copper amine oxidase N-terminal domain-containing protein [Paenibacillus faecis]